MPGRLGQEAAVPGSFTSGTSGRAASVRPGPAARGEGTGAEPLAALPPPQVDEPCGVARGAFLAAARAAAARAAPSR
ncbi:hypothetical protein [Streptomyces sp. URMC 124]|uniref:hypothetical protein n=1 Tax=Streptomyces sp. URMC 124 TaxID=3423405 RepID=UPI003F19D5F4